MVKSKDRPGILSWSEEDRPREKLILKGPQSLTDSELLAIFIHSGTKQKNAIELAREILQKAGNDLDALAQLSVKQLTSIKGIGQAKAVTIAAALEFGRRRKENTGLKNPKISSSRDVYENIYADLADKAEENFIVLYLNRANQIIKKSIISKGGVSGTTVDPRIIFREAIENLASGIVLAHNHPSGNLNPSPEDLRLTNKIKEGALYFNMKLTDHLIFTNTGYYSFADEGIL